MYSIILLNLFIFKLKTNVINFIFNYIANTNNNNIFNILSKICIVH